MKKLRIYFEFFMGGRNGMGEVLKAFSKAKGISAMKKVEEYEFSGL